MGVAPKSPPGPRADVDTLSQKCPGRHSLLRRVQTKRPKTRKQMIAIGDNQSFQLRNLKDLLKSKLKSLFFSRFFHSRLAGRSRGLSTCPGPLTRCSAGDQGGPWARSSWNSVWVLLCGSPTSVEWLLISAMWQAGPCKLRNEALSALKLTIRT